LSEDRTTLQLARFSAIEENLTARYGENSQARAFFLYEQLVTVRLALSDAADGHTSGLLSRRREWLRQEIQAMYDRAPFPGEQSTPVLHPVDAPGVIEYDREAFERRYAEAAELIRPQVVSLEDWRPRIELRPTGYMYVVDDTGRLLVWDRPFTMAQMLVGRDRVTVGRWTVGHPMLVPERRRVLAAGEIVPVGSDDGTVRGVVANLKSGHFRPPPQAAHAVIAACHRQAGVRADDCDIFTIPPAARSSVPGSSSEVV